MFYKEIEPVPGLKSVITCFWMLEHDYREAFHTHEHLWADTHAELIFTFGEPYYVKGRSGKQVLPPSFVIGPYKKELLLYSDGFTGFVAVRFKPWGLYPFSLKPCVELVNTIIPAAEIFGKEIERLSKQLQNEKREGKVAMLQQYFQEQFSTRAKKKIECLPLASKIMEEKGIVKISQLAGDFSLNARQLERIFKTEIGMSAKLFARIVRFNQAKKRIEQDPDISIAQLTYEMGYADQAHFSKNFRELFDLSPNDFKKQMKEFMAGYDDHDMDVVFLQDQ
jgi:AraC-like DNA-binding protein